MSTPDRSSPRCSRRVLLGAGAAALVPFVCADRASASFATGQSRVLNALGAAAGNVQVRFVNGAAGAPALDVAVSGKQLASGLGFGKSTSFVPLASGRHTLTITAAGADTRLLSYRMDLKSGLSYEVAIFGDYPTLQAQEFGVVVRAASPGKARLRIVQLSSDLPPVDVAVKGGAVLYTDITFPGATAYDEVAAGSIALEVRPTGKRTITLAIPKTAVTEGTVYDIVLIGRAADKTLRAVTLTANVETETSSGAPQGPPTAADVAYLASFKGDRNLLLLSLQKLDSLTQNPQPNDQNWNNQFALVFQVWAVVDLDLYKIAPAARYQALWTAYAAVADPLASTARQQSNVYDYLSGASDTIDFPNLDLNVVVDTVVQILPLLQDAEAQYAAAMTEAGLSTT